MNHWKVLKTEEDYNAATGRLMEIFQVPQGSADAEELELLILLVKDYDERHYSLPAANPLEIIRLKMEERGLKAKDLEPVIGSKGHVSAILSGKRELTLKMARKLRTFFKSAGRGVFANGFVSMALAALFISRKVGLCLYSTLCQVFRLGSCGRQSSDCRVICVT